MEIKFIIQLEKSNLISLSAVHLVLILFVAAVWNEAAYLEMSLKADFYCL